MGRDFELQMVADMETVLGMYLPAILQKFH